MWNQFKTAVQRAGARSRAKRELNDLLDRDDAIFHDLGLNRVDVLRVRREMRFL